MIAPKTHNPKPPTTPHPVRWTHQEYHTLGELGVLDDRRVEFIKGEIIEMSPKGWPHVVACRKTAELLEKAFAGIGWVARQEPLTTIDSEPEPDVSVHSGRFEDYANHPTSALLIVEVADTSLDYDTTTKAELYATANIPDYWVLDLVNSRLLVFRDPMPTAIGGGAYRTHFELGPTQSITSLSAPGYSIRVADLLP